MLVVKVRAHSQVEALTNLSFVVWILEYAFKAIKSGAGVGGNSSHSKVAMGVTGAARAAAGSKADHRLRKWVRFHNLKLRMLACVVEEDCPGPHTCLLAFQTNPCNVAHIVGLGSRSSQTILRDDLNALDPLHCHGVVHTCLPMLPDYEILIIHNSWPALA